MMQYCQCVHGNPYMRHEGYIGGIFKKNPWHKSVTLDWIHDWSTLSCFFLHLKVCGSIETTREATLKVDIA